MASDTLNRQYAHLTAQERFELALSAMARGDQRETQRLQKSCPRQTYSQMDTDCVGRIDSSRTATMVWALLWEEAFREYVVFCVAARDSPIRVAPDGSHLSVMPLVGRLLALYLGLAWFCDSIRCTPHDTLRAWWPPLADRVASFLEADLFRLLDDDFNAPDPFAVQVLGEAADTERMLAAAWPFPRNPTVDEDAFPDDDVDEEGDAATEGPPAAKSPQIGD